MHQNYFEDNNWPSVAVDSVPALEGTISKSTKSITLDCNNFGHVPVAAFPNVSVAQNINAIIITYTCTSEHRKAQPIVIIEEHIFWLDAFFPTRRLIRTLLGPQV